MADINIPPQPQVVNGQVVPMTVVSSQPVSGTTSGSSQKVMTPEQRAAYNAWLQSQAQVDAALASPPPMDTGTPGEATPPPPPPAPPAPPNTAALPPMMGIPLGIGAALQPEPPPHVAAPVEKKGPQTFEAAQDARTLYEAGEKERIAQDVAAKQAEIQRVQDLRRKEMEARVERRAAEMEKAGDIRSLWADQSTPTRILKGIAAAISNGAVARIGGTGMGPVAMQIQKEIENDLGIKKSRLQTAIDKYKMAGAGLENVDKWAKGQQEALLAYQKAQLASVEATGNKMLAPFPQAQRAYQLEIAKVRAEAEKKKLDTIADLTATTRTAGTSNEGVKVTSTEGKGGSSMTEAEGKKAQYASQMLEAVDRIEKGANLKDSDFRKLQNNMTGMAAAVASAKDMTSDMRIRFFKKAGLSPDSLTAGLSPQAKTVALDWLIATGLLIRDQSGAAITLPEDMTNWQKFGPQPGDTPDVVKTKLGNLKRNAQIMMSLAGPEAARRIKHADQMRDSETAKPAAPPPPKPAATPPKSGTDLATRLGKLPANEQPFAAQMLSMKPSNPNYKRAQQWLKEKGLR